MSYFSFPLAEATITSCAPDQFIVVVFCWTRWSTKQEKGREIVEEYDREPNRSSWLEFYLMLSYVVIEC
jgi:hypothetical protein